MTRAEDDLSRNYAGAFDGHLTFGKRPALVIVDAARAYFEPSSPLYAGAEAALESMERLLGAAREAGLMVIFTKVEYEPGGADGGVFYRKVPALSLFDRGSELGTLMPSLEPRPGEIVITKRYASSFFGTDLASTLVSSGIDTLVIAGVSTSGCIRATALDACQHGFLPFVVGEACGDRHREPHEAALFDLQAKYAEVISEADAISRILAAHGKD